VTNPVIDQERASFINARKGSEHARVPAWPRTDKELKIVELEVDWVRLSTLNHRTKAEQRAEVARAANPTLFTLDPLGRTAQDAQYKILSKQEAFDDLKHDMQERGQQEPAIVTADGVLINGNRRAAALRSLYFDDKHLAAKYVRCLVLPADATVAELIDLETELQIARDFKQEYGWINEALLIEELFERENKDFATVATRMHRKAADVRSLYDKLQQVHQLVDLSCGARLHIDFNENESAFDELAKHIKNKQPAEAEAVRSVYFIGTLAGANYRDLRNLRRADAAALVRDEIESDPTLKQILDAVEEALPGPATEVDILDDLLGADTDASPLTPLLALLATKKPDETLVLPDGREVDVQDVFGSIQSAIAAAADDAKEDQNDQATLTAPLNRVKKAIGEFERALAALPKARLFSAFDEAAVSRQVLKLRELIDKYPGDES